MDTLLAAYLLAQSPACAPTGTIERELTGKYAESIVSAGLTAAGRVVTFANPATGTFTIVLVRPDGLTCMVAGGKGFTTIEASKPGTDT